MARRKPPTHQPFESNIPSGQFTKICTDMMNSAAWESLSLRQRGLYLELKKKYRQKNSNGVLESSNIDNISFTQREAKVLYKGNLRGFRADIDALIEAGFIRTVERGRATRTANIYGFTDRWKRYGAPDYQVPISDRRDPKRHQKHPPE